ncbi:MAG: hypothetical protein JWO23_1574 [Solirubrobacterales bacterium]|jgi:hypothetical protein|nr:hypothetical protein [Solirubrobacterales bacterium]
MSPRVFQRPPVDQWLRERLLDEALERYLDWRAESEAVDVAYRVWSVAPAADGATPFSAYRAALDREERAATVYCSVIERAALAMDGEPQLAIAQSEVDRL